MKLVLAVPSDQELCALSFEDEAEEEVQVEEERPRKRRHEQEESGTGWQALLATSVSNITELLAEQQKQINNGTGGAPFNEILLNTFKSLKTQEDTNKLVVNLITNQTALKSGEEEFTREKAIVFAFDGGEDDAETIIDHKVRNGLRPYRGLDWAARWESRGRHAKPRWESLAIPELGTITIAPVVIRNMHDRGKDLKIAMFLHTNADVSIREGKFRRVGESGREVMHEMFEWREPESTQSIAEAVLAYTICLWRIWEEDWSGLVLMKVMTRYKYLANAKVSRKMQITLVSQYINSFFGLCAAAGRDLKPPPKWRDAEQLMIEHLDKNCLDQSVCKTGRDPYDLRPTNSSGNSQQQRNDNQTPRNQRGGGQGGRGGQQHDQRRGGGQPQAGRPRDIFSLPIGQLSYQEKVAVACRDWNSAQGSTDAGCNFKHKCSVPTGNGRLCFGHDHNAIAHV